MMCGGCSGCLCGVSTTDCREVTGGRGCRPTTTGDDDEEEAGEGRADGRGAEGGTNREGGARLAATAVAMLSASDSLNTRGQGLAPSRRRDLVRPMPLFAPSPSRHGFRRSPILTERVRQLLRFPTPGCLAPRLARPNPPTTPGLRYPFLASAPAFKQHNSRTGMRHKYMEQNILSCLIRSACQQEAQAWKAGGKLRCRPARCRNGVQAAPENRLTGVTFMPMQSMC